MTKKIDEHEGSKYLRKIHSAKRDKSPIQVDVYNVLEAFKVTCPARQHAIKKLLCAGIRGKGNELDDLIGAEAAVARAIELEKDRQVDLIMGETWNVETSDALDKHKWAVYMEAVIPEKEPKPAKEKPAKEKK